MRLKLSYNAKYGEIEMIASKSIAHRLLICSAFGNKKVRIECAQTNADIDATANCLCALGANIIRDGKYFEVEPIQKVKKNAILDCNESGSTLRFLIPIVAVIGANSTFIMRGRLPERPLSPLSEELTRLGISLTKKDNTLICEGKLTSLSFSISGSVSSQFISGLLLAIAISGNKGEIKITDKLESSPYVDLTVDALSLFGINTEYKDNTFTVKGDQKLCSKEEITVEGDWSAAAFPLAAGAIGKYPVTVKNINISSRQGDRAIISLLEAFGAKTEYSNNSVTVYPSELHGIEIDAAEIPDLVPILATVATVADGKTLIYNASRLRIKESDRLSSTSQMLNTLGAKVTELEDGLEIHKVNTLMGGEVSSYNDHRIAMSAAIASTVANNNIIIDGAEATKKSYPSFFADMSNIGIISTED